MHNLFYSAKKKLMQKLPALNQSQCSNFLCSIKMQISYFTNLSKFNSFFLLICISQKANLKYLIVYSNHSKPCFVV